MAKPEFNEQEARLDALCLSLPQATASYDRPTRWRADTITWYVGTGLNRAFCHLQRDTGTIAFRASETLEGFEPFDPQHGPTNFVGSSIALVDWSRMPDRMAESHRLAQMRAGGFHAHGEFESAHPIFRAALEQLPEELREPPWHGGAVAPKLSGTVAREIAHWSASLVVGLAPKDQRAQAQEILKAIRQVLDGSADEKAKRLVFDAGQKRTKVLAVMAAYRAAGAALAKPDMAWIGGKATTERVARCLLEAGDQSPMPAAEYVRELDHRIACEEVNAELAKRKGLNSSSQPVRVLWRGVDERDFTAYWCVRLDNGDYGFLGKIGRRFLWVEGNRNDTFANVPDQLFEEAAATARLRDR